MTFQQPGAVSPSERFGETLAELRAGFGMTQRELARRLGLSPSHLNRIERGHKPPPNVQSVLSAVSALHLSPEAAADLVTLAGYSAAALAAVPGDRDDLLRARIGGANAHLGPLGYGKLAELHTTFMRSRGEKWIYDRTLPREILATDDAYSDWWITTVKTLGADMDRARYTLGHRIQLAKSLLDPDTKVRFAIPFTDAENYILNGIVGYHYYEASFSIWRDRREDRLKLLAMLIALLDRPNFELGFLEDVLAPDTFRLANFEWALQVLPLGTPHDGFYVTTDAPEDIERYRAVFGGAWDSLPADAKARDKVIARLKSLSKQINGRAE